jgi:hypothetical protein
MRSRTPTLSEPRSCFVRVRDSTASVHESDSRRTGVGHGNLEPITGLSNSERMTSASPPAWATLKQPPCASANVPHCSSSGDSFGLKLAGPILQLQQRYPTAAPGGHRDRRPTNEGLPGRRDHGQHNASTIDYRLRGRCARTRQRRQHSPDICAVRPCMACGRVRALRSACLSLMRSSQCCDAHS